MALAGKPPAPDLSKYPDLRTVMPDHLNLVNQQQNEHLRFSNGIANTGPGPWALRPDPPIRTASITSAVQEIRSSNAQLRQPEGHRDRSLRVREPRHVRRPLAEPVPTACAFL